MSKIKITQIRSTIAVPAKVRRVVEGLGLRGIGQSRVYNDNNCVRGMVNKISHLIKYELIKS